MSNTPEVTSSGVSQLIGEGQFIFMTTLLEFKIDARIVTVGAARIVITPDTIVTLAKSYVLLPRRKFLVQSG